MDVGALTTLGTFALTDRKRMMVMMMMMMIHLNG
jgi:hypothetical protein